MYHDPGTAGAGDIRRGDRRRPRHDPDQCSPQHDNPRRSRGRRWAPATAPIFGSDPRIERSLDLALARTVVIEKMVGVGRDHPFGQVERLDQEKPPEIACCELAVRLRAHRRGGRDVSRTSRATQSG